MNLASISRLFLAVLLSHAAATGPVWAIPADQIKKPDKPPYAVGNKIGLAFSQSSQYKREFKEAVAGAYKACRDWMKAHPGQNGAIVSDIDETLLDNRPFMKDHPDFKWDEFLKWFDEARASKLPLTANFLRWARHNGFAIFLVTGRNEQSRKGTIVNLVRQGIAYDGLLMRPDNDERPAEDVKVPLRKAIEAMGFEIVVNIGDQYSDLSGGHAIDAEKLPNRLYFVE